MTSLDKGRELTANPTATKTSIAHEMARLQTALETIRG